MFQSFIAKDIIAEHLLACGAVSFLMDKPMRLKSGLITPIYVDNRVLFSYPDAWRDVIETMASKIEELGLKFDIVAGVEGAGTAHGAALAYRLSVPFITVRQVAKTYGNHSRIDGVDVNGKKVLIIEDHLSTGLSLLDAIKVLRAEGAIVSDCFAITNFDMPETSRLFEKNNIKAHQMLAFSFILDKALKMGKIDSTQLEELNDWLETPWSWAAKRGLLVSSTEN
ncbi:MAG: orotate phosphoribosyltransferase [Burkholderiaceae bacterium]|nr:orotate phosphoribosyltransferase [Burkholderiaceae bacterium]